MQIADLLRFQTRIEKLQIMSFDMNIYLVNITTAKCDGLIKDASGRPQRFKSVTQVKDELQQCQVMQAELIHESPYDEMVGNPERVDNKLVIPVNMTEAYWSNWL